jgi:putative acetyltransferase
MLIRDEQPHDVSAVHNVLIAAFPTDAEARLVERLRANSHTPISLVAVIAGQIVGHILFSPVSIDGNPELSDGLGLAPVAVVPVWQRNGVGSRLIEAGIEDCRQQGCQFVVVLGHPAYYPRFGFQKASLFRLDNEYGAQDEFMVLELQPESLPAAGGQVKYGPEFSEFGI